jgi:hypothetical protein
MGDRFLSDWGSLLSSAAAAECASVSLLHPSSSVVAATPTGRRAADEWRPIIFVCGRWIVRPDEGKEKQCRHANWQTTQCLNSFFKSNDQKQGHKNTAKVC